MTNERTLSQAKSTADRVAAFVAKRNEIGDIPPPLRPALRESCRLDLAKFGWVYCRSLLDHQPSAEFKLRIVDKIQTAILHGGQVAVEALRGGGKTTWFTIATVWGILYGHIRFPIIICASQPLAKNLRRAVLTCLESSKPIAEDFPAVALPLQKMGGIAQRGLSLTYRGKPTGFVSTDAIFRLADLKDADGHRLDCGCGAVIAVRGVGSTIRGLNVDGVRPDFALLDDPQTQKDARSDSRCQVLEEYIHSDVLGLAANTSTISAFIAITPQRFGDLAHRIFDRTLHPNWNASVCPAILHYCEHFDELADEFAEVYLQDVANEDFERTASRAWYREHRDNFAAVVMLDPLAYDKDHEEDALHHCLVKMCAIGKTAFAAEYQMVVEAANAELNLTPEQVARAVNATPAWILPAQCDSVVASCDVNIKEGQGFSWVVVGFSRRRIAAVIAYGRYPERGRLVPKDATELEKSQAISRGIFHVIELIRNHRITKPNGQAVNLRALSFDRGYNATAICTTLRHIRESGRYRIPFQLAALRGAGWQNFGKDKRHALAAGDQWAVYSGEKLGEYLEFCAPYWREVAQSGFLETPLMPASTSIFGTADNIQGHWAFASEICAERLVRKWTHPSGKTAWDWQTTGQANHWLDALTNAFALGSYFRCFAPIESLIVKPSPNADLFDPRLNAAVNANAAALAPREAVAPQPHIKPRARFAAPAYKRR